MPSITLLGPQQHRVNLVETLDELGVKGPVAAITAGWEERESELDELSEIISRDTVNLRLHGRLEELQGDDEVLRDALESRNSRLLTMQLLYRRRLDHALQAVWELQRLRVAEMEILISERASALKEVARLDNHYLDELRVIHRAFETRLRPERRPAVVSMREEIAGELEGCNALLIAGGNVGTLIDPMRLFQIARHIGERPIIAWSAGAMVLCERIVFFHDSPPQGKGNPEVYDDGLGLCPGVVALPHAGTRLRLDDPVRVEVFARRFAPASCVALDSGSALHWDGQRWTKSYGARKLTQTGAVRRMATP